MMEAGLKYEADQWARAGNFEREDVELPFLRLQRFHRNTAA